MRIYSSTGFYFKYLINNILQHYPFKHFLSKVYILFSHLKVVYILLWFLWNIFGCMQQRQRKSFQHFILFQRGKQYLLLHWCLEKNGIRCESFYILTSLQHIVYIAFPPLTMYLYCFPSVTLYIVPSLPHIVYIAFLPSHYIYYLLPPHDVFVLLSLPHFVYNALPPSRCICIAFPPLQFYYYRRTEYKDSTFINLENHFISALSNTKRNLRNQETRNLARTLVMSFEDIRKRNKFENFEIYF